MRPRQLIQFHSIALLVIAGMLGDMAGAAPQGSSKAQPPAAIARVRVILGRQGPSVEVTASRPVTPEIIKVENPPRLVVDLPNSVMSVQSKKIDVQSDQISAVRLNQNQKSPPVVRIVIDLLKAVTYSSSANGNVLTVRLAAEVAKAPEVPSVPALTSGDQPVAVPVSTGSTGAVVVTGSRMAPGSSLTAGADTAVMRLGRGGEVRVCPGTTVSVTSSKTGNDLMLGMSTGALEVHYSLNASADSVLTPDFRILLAGPGEFDMAVSADSRGNTCVRALAGNTASAIISELMGEGTYQVKPNEQVMFHSGRLTAIDQTVPANCGCPAPPPAVLQASAQSPTMPDENVPSSMRLAKPDDVAKPIPPPASTSSLPANGPPPAQVTLSIAGTGPETAPLPATNPNDVHVQVEAPVVFRASDADPLAAPPPTSAVKQLPVNNSQPMAPAETVVLPPPEQAQPTPQAKPKGFFGKVKGFFASIFH